MKNKADPKIKPVSQEAENSFRVSGANYLGKLATIIVRTHDIEVGALSFFLLTVGVCVCAVGTTALVLTFGSLVLNAAALLLGGLAGFFILYRLHPGKLVLQFDYSEIVSFVSDQNEMTINLQDRSMYVLRLSRRKQAKLYLAIARLLAEGKTYFLEPSGAYYRIKPVIPVEKDEKQSAKKKKN